MSSNPAACQVRDVSHGSAAWAYAEGGTATGANARFSIRPGVFEYFEYVSFSLPRLSGINLEESIMP